MGKNGVPNSSPQVGGNTGSADDRSKNIIKGTAHLKKAGKYMGGFIPLGQVITFYFKKHFPIALKFTEIFKAFELMEKGESLRVVLTP